MQDYEVLKETKVIYEYINDLLSNCDYVNSNKEFCKILNQNLEVLGKIYSNCYQIMLENNDEDIKVGLDCPHCNQDVVISDLIDYAYLCENCDENMYLGEGDLNNEWYFDGKDKKLNKSFNINIDYNNKSKMLLIATEDSSGAKYNCGSLKEVENCVSSYIEDYLVGNEYTIKIWETDEEYDKGESFLYLKTFYDEKSAIEEARKILSRQNYSAIEVIRDNDEEEVFFSNGIEEVQLYNSARISYVSKDILEEYINNYSKNIELPISNNLLYCEFENKIVAINNKNENCKTETFETVTDAIRWLSEESNKEIKGDEYGI